MYVPNFVPGGQNQNSTVAIDTAKMYFNVLLSVALRGEPVGIFTIDTPQCVFLLPQKCTFISLTLNLVPGPRTLSIIFFQF